MTPYSSPASTSDFISSRDTFSSKSVSLIPMTRSNTLVDKDKSLTKGFANLKTKTIGLTDNIAICSDFCKAIRLGTSSPKTSVK